MTETIRDAVRRTIRVGDTVGGTTSGRYQATIVGPVLKIGKGQVKVRVDQSGHTYSAAVGDEKWISTGRVFLIPAEQPAPPARRDQFEAWLKTQRDRWFDDTGAEWRTLDDLLDRYRLHADTGTPLAEHVCEGRAAGDCECLETVPAAEEPT